MKEIRIGLIGAGTVGGGVVKILANRTESIRRDLGLPIRLARIADKATERFTTLPVGNAICTGDANDILNDPDIDIVIELVGGTTFAKKLVLDALSKGKHVITANKALIAEFGSELFACADEHGVSLHFEAAVGGGMPVIKTIREALVGNNLFSVKTIINGTCNYILSKMSAQGLPFETVLAEAQKNGYAEANPALDIGGGDSGHKVAIMASLVSGGYVPFSSVAIEGITSISQDDIAYARELGYTIKLLGVIKKGNDDAALDVRVHPAMLPKNHILASVSDVFNAVLLEGDAVGQILLYGKGAGDMPTGSAVMSDIVDVARNIAAETPIRISTAHYNANRKVPVKAMDDLESRYYLRFTVQDSPGVLAAITSHLSSQGISIASVIQKEEHPETGVPVILLTHKAVEKNLRAALSAIEAMPSVMAPTQVIRIES